MIIPVIQEVWLNNRSEFVFVEYNPCRCCPNAVTMEWGKGFNEARSYGDHKGGALTKKLLSRGWERLGRHRWTFERPVSK